MAPSRKARLLPLLCSGARKPNFPKKLSLEFLLFDQALTPVTDELHNSEPIYKIGSETIDRNNLLHIPLSGGDRKAQAKGTVDSHS
jgi:hypothetical protein